MGFAVPAVHRLTLKKIEKKNNYLDIAKELKNIGYVIDIDANCKWHTRYSHQSFGTEIRGLRNKRASRDQPIDSIVEIGHKTKNSPEDFRRHARTQTLVKNIG